ncbi:MAG: hypothetical protein AAFO15_00365 [Pseudomonadota bacterium]
MENRPEEKNKSRYYLYKNRTQQGNYSIKMFQYCTKKDLYVEYTNNLEPKDGKKTTDHSFEEIINYAIENNLEKTYKDISHLYYKNEKIISYIIEKNMKDNTIVKQRFYKYGFDTKSVLRASYNKKTKLGCISPSITFKHTKFGSISSSESGTESNMKSNMKSNIRSNDSILYTVALSTNTIIDSKNKFVILRKDKNKNTIDDTIIDNMHDMFQDFMQLLYNNDNNIHIFYDHIINKKKLDLSQKKNTKYLISKTPQSNNNNLVVEKEVIYQHELDDKKIQIIYDNNKYITEINIIEYYKTINDNKKTINENMTIEFKTPVFNSSEIRYLISRSTQELLENINSIGITPKTNIRKIKIHQFYDSGNKKRDIVVEDNIFNNYDNDSSDDSDIEINIVTKKHTSSNVKDHSTLANKTIKEYYNNDNNTLKSIYFARSKNEKFIELFFDRNGYITDHSITELFNSKINNKNHTCYRKRIKRCISKEDNDIKVKFNENYNKFHFIDSELDHIRFNISLGDNIDSGNLDKYYKKNSIIEKEIINYTHKENCYQKGNILLIATQKYIFDINNTLEKYIQTEFEYKDKYKELHDPENNDISCMKSPILHSISQIVTSHNIKGMKIHSKYTPKHTVVKTYRGDFYKSTPNKILHIEYENRCNSKYENRFSSDGIRIKHKQANEYVRDGDKKQVAILTKYEYLYSTNDYCDWGRYYGLNVKQIISCRKDGTIYENNITRNVDNEETKKNLCRKEVRFVFNKQGELLFAHDALGRKYIVINSKVLRFYFKDLHDKIYNYKLQVNKQIRFLYDTTKKETDKEIEKLFKEVKQETNKKTVQFLEEIQQQEDKRIQNLLITTRQEESKQLEQLLKNTKQETNRKIPDLIEEVKQKETGQTKEFLKKITQEENTEIPVSQKIQDFLKKTKQEADKKIAKLVEEVKQKETEKRKASLNEIVQEDNKEIRQFFKEALDGNSYFLDVYRTAILNSKITSNNHLKTESEEYLLEEFDNDLVRKISNLITAFDCKIIKKGDNDYDLISNSEQDASEESIEDEVELQEERNKLIKEFASSLIKTAYHNYDLIGNANVDKQEVVANIEKEFLRNSRSNNSMFYMHPRDLLPVDPDSFLEEDNEDDPFDGDEFIDFDK